MWFNIKHIKVEKPIYIENLHGYVLPHGDTEFTGGIISHTLRFRPLKKIKKVIIFYYPASAMPNIINKYYHEYYVPWQAMQSVFADKGYIYEGCNVKKGEMSNMDLTDSFLVISADFSHFLPMQEAIALENKAARSLMFKEIKKDYVNVVDHLDTFKTLFELLPEAWQLQWVGRGRSVGLNAVGYLSFLLRETPPSLFTLTKPYATKPDGLFVTAYSNDMTARECQGIWFTEQKWSLRAETNLIKNVLTLGETTSRLTGGLNIKKPLTHYSITYLYKDLVNPFIRGWHGILHHAFYLPDVFLEHTFNNGKWITARDTSWPKDDKFDIAESLRHLRTKSGLTGGHFIPHKRSKKNKYRLKKTYRKKGGQMPYTLYSTRLVHYIL